MWPEDAENGLSAQERALDRLLREAHLAADHDLPTLFRSYAEALGGRDPVAYLADLQQRVLVPFRDTDRPERDNHGALVVDATLAGRAYQHIEVLTQPLAHSERSQDGAAGTSGTDGRDSADGTDGTDGTDGRTAEEVRVWLPMLDGSERLGLLAVVVPARAWAESPALRARLLRFAAVAAELVMTKTMYGDTLVRLRRTNEMNLAAEMQWSLLPPLTFASPLLTIAGGLEPAYEVAGDTIDYAVDRSLARLAIFDGMGHGLHSA